METLDENSLGELLMHFMLETIVASISSVDPFDQPAVEEAKVLAKKYLAASVLVIAGLPSAIPQVQRVIRFMWDRGDARVAGMTLN